MQKLFAILVATVGVTVASWSLPAEAHAGIFTFLTNVFLVALLKAGASVLVANVLAYVAATAVIVGALYGLSQLLPRPGGLGVVSAPDVQSIVRVAKSARRWVFGTYPVGGVIVFEEENNYDYHVAVALSEDTCEGITELWHGPVKIPFTATPIADADGGGRKLTCTGDYQDRLVVYEYFKADGTQGKALRDVATGWTTKHKLNFISWAYFHFNQNDVGFDFQNRFWQVPPEAMQLQVVMQGVKLRSWTSAIKNWTENVTDIRYWFDTVRRGLSKLRIHQASYNAARLKSGEEVTITFPEEETGYEDWDRTERRYTFNGVYYSTDDPLRFMQVLDASWQGVSVEANGIAYYRPGVVRPATAHITQDDLLREPIVETTPALTERFNAVTVSLQKSKEHEWEEVTLPEIVDQPALTRDGIKLTYDVGTLIGQIYPVMAGRLATSRLKEAQHALTYQCVVSARRDFSLAQLIPTDIVTVTDTRYGLNGDTMRVQSITILPDFEVQLILKKWASTIYDDSLIIPPLHDRLGAPAAPAAPTGVTSDEFVEFQGDGTEVIFLRIDWAHSAAPFNVIRWRKQGDTAWVYEETEVATFRINNVIVGQTYQVQIRYKWPTVVGPWSTLHTNTIDGDLTAPATPSGLSATALVQGYQLTWTYPTEKDYGETQIQENSVEVARVKGDTYARQGLTSYTSRSLRVRHRDQSGNASAWSQAVSVTPLAPEDLPTLIRVGGTFTSPSTYSLAANTWLTLNGSLSAFYSTKERLLWMLDASIGPGASVVPSGTTANLEIQLRQGNAIIHSLVSDPIAIAHTGVIYFTGSFIYNLQRSQSQTYTYRVRFRYGAGITTLGNNRVRVTLTAISL